MKRCVLTTLVVTVLFHAQVAVAMNVIDRGKWDAVDVTVSSSIGNLWVLGKNSYNWGHQIYHMYHMDDGSSRWGLLYGLADRVSVGRDGKPWVVNAKGDIWHWNGSQWERRPDSAIDVGVGANGSVFKVGIENRVWKWTGSSWTKEDYEGMHNAKRIDVTRDGVPWVVTEDGEIYYWDEYQWKPKWQGSGYLFKDIGIGGGMPESIVAMREGPGNYDLLYNVRYSLPQYICPVWDGQDIYSYQYGLSLDVGGQSGVPGSVGWWRSQICVACEDGKLRCYMYEDPWY